MGIDKVEQMCYTKEMKAEDTVMTDVTPAVLLQNQRELEGLLREQAEISFKAGIDTLWEEIQKLGYQRVLDDLVIMGKLKEWGYD